MLVTSDVPKKEENASVTGSCGSSLILGLLADAALTGSGFGAGGAAAGVLLMGPVLGRLTVAAFGRGGDGIFSVAFVDKDIVGVVLGAAKKGVFDVVSLTDGGGSLGGEGNELVAKDDEGGSFATGLLPLTIRPSDRRYSSTPALVIALSAAFWALFNNKLRVRVCNKYKKVMRE